MEMLTDQNRAPIIEGMEAFQKKSAASFSLPGHKSGKGAAEDVKRLMGEGVFKSDTSTQKGIDDRWRASVCCRMRSIWPRWPGAPTIATSRPTAPA